MSRLVVPKTPCHTIRKQMQDVTYVPGLFRHPCSRLDAEVSPPGSLSVALKCLKEEPLHACAFTHRYMGPTQHRAAAPASTEQCPRLDLLLRLDGLRLCTSQSLYCG